MARMVWLLAAAGVLVAETLPMKTVVVYKQEGRFAGWPANHGIWSWGNEILVGFESGYFQFSRAEHSIDYKKPEVHLLARSLDGGETWTIEEPASLQPPEGLRIAGVPVAPGGRQPLDCPGGIDFTQAGFVMTMRMADVDIGPSRFYYSYDRGKTWNGPFKVPDFGQRGIAARTDYLINGPHDCTVFLTAAKPNGHEGRVICTRTRDGGKTWKLMAFVTAEPEGNDYSIMPSSVRLSPASILTAVRYRHRNEVYRSDDDGATWRFLSKPVPRNDNPPSMIKLRDGRIALAYGVRSKPFGVRARVSKDNGATWGEEIMLRADGGSWDLGYARSVERPDGKIVTVYYFNDAPEHEREIEATIWDSSMIP